jgi:hypothetical protein
LRAIFALLATSIWSGCQQSITSDQGERVLAWLTCEECIDGELGYVVDSIGRAATPLLTEMLVATPEDHLANAERALGLAWSRREPPRPDSAAYVDQFLANYAATLQSRSAVALGRLGEQEVLLDAYDRRVALGLREDVVAAIENALTRLGAGRPGFAPPAVTNIQLRPLAVEVELGDSAVLEAVPLDASGRMRPGRVTWSISDSSIATPVAAAQGDSTWIRVRGNALGGATVTATTGRATSRSTISVVEVVAPGRIVIVSGSGQVFTVGQPHQPLVVRVEDASGVGVGAAQVVFRVIRGGSPVEVDALTNASGEASLTVIPAPTAGPVAVDAAVTATQPPLGLLFRPSMVRFQLTAVEP